MQEKDFRFIDNGMNEEGGVCTINLFQGIDEFSANSFVWDFEHLVKYWNPSRIDIRINSAGGSVFHGWTIVDAILSSAIPTRAIVVGVAASMASVIMSACTEVHMKDYASIMVHNPFYCGGSKPDVEDEQLATFRAQLITMYMKRWQKSEEEVIALMDGKEGQDGTWIKAAEAKQMGIVSDIIETPAQIANDFLAVRDEILNSSAAAELIQSRFQEILNNVKQEETINMKEVIARLGLEETANEATILVAVAALQDKTNALEATVATLNVEKAGAEATINAANATIAEKTTAIEALQAQVNEFKAAEVAAEDARRLGIVEAAIEEGKINEADKDKWVSLFASAPEVTESVIAQLAAIGEKKKLSNVVKPDVNANADTEGGFKLPSVADKMSEIAAKADARLKGQIKK